MIRNNLPEPGGDFLPGTSTSGSCTIVLGSVGTMSLRPAVVGRGMRTLSILVYKNWLEGGREGGRGVSCGRVGLIGSCAEVYSTIRVPLV